jgi:uncharacterized protein
MIDEIQKIKIALTSKCTLRCNHCNIDKVSASSISIDYALKTVDFILSSKGKDKRIEIYGGEPFTEFEKLKILVKYIRQESQIRNKTTSIHVASNGTIVNDEILDWLKKNDIFLAISFSGSRKSHNYNRKFPNAKGSYQMVKENIKKIIDTIGNKRLVCIYCIDPEFSSSILDDFKKIINLGIRIVDIECVSGCMWGENDYTNLISGIKEINKYILKLAGQKKYIFHEVFTEYLRTKNLCFPNCPGYMDIELYPDGNLGFYPYAFINYNRYKNKISIGTARKGINKKYSKCKYKSKRCDDCVKNYYTLQGLDDGSKAYEIRNKIIINFFKELVSISSKNCLANNYFKQTIKLSNFFYDK